MRDDRLAERHVVVTGAAQGIGRGIATRVARAGADVSIFDVNAEDAETTAELVREEGGRAAVYEVDVTDAAAIEGALDAAVEAFGPVDGLVNNAGVQQSIPVLETTEEQWDRHMDVNAKGVFLCSKAVATRMREAGIEGSIVNVASVGAVRPFPGQGVYAATKAGVTAFGVVLAKELADDGITVNSVNPGTIDTPMVEAWLEENAEQAGTTPEEVLAETVEMHVLNRIGRPEEVGHAVTFLLSEEAAWITGESLNVDGGFTVN
ncbi:3-oxoacyl-[acyl-carrier protein] reductase [Halopelagius inordinatus]|uniref:3-oxoacyl-[acyl-carrier protein] reductase n=1 Tax=Halopelagius inordinatus TaxID=553467 RepID=A0A1I2WR38_9EURY|nr:SDR family NAD(P)-dependent oxidoreductase [Halopelagius inordinatus]SFH03850.1 3-oxoacyl-[acyl-carrier protein] reductase [Halopelagius inordinatus]